ncbi:hypothetical protein B0I72DRAFT_142551 [Yarrowia lipolytica]|uniref:YALI0E31772p n=2 Tax=Yarrowia lipolytica TaxID=4952 RepID=B5FVG2_YARLI|nr:YALI0E31772p [Yarrowia lipolytica CLIB122]KAB8285484.1 hypothetical protein BKA91DRAFT_133135 [Yarrowia lipolytica]KAE8175427.1 hypothetical protein BKA90DRAFT_132635 [Yarrowia lipolytica]QNQ00860.1 hypothetical protein YALI2_F00405g [Yarrowia lipolytica]RDW24088.1 hypothetical protein B0I71DRAFT_134860 [Yarrowia lipolytica]RDW29835.1 hypothetical protein B0I72DRAFT_142551 [Yarrowia lipolytica]|eukprot:XP_002143091.1 YALI0E31772p [Yarrowia lipolytica CLIB122]
MLTRFQKPTVLAGLAAATAVSFYWVSRQAFYSQAQIVDNERHVTVDRSGGGI